MNGTNSTKFAFLINCIDGINLGSLYPRFIDNFPLNSAIFLFCSGGKSGMNRRLKRFASPNHEVQFIPTFGDAISIDISFKLGQICDKYDEFILISNYDPVYEDICERLIATNVHLENHVQFRCLKHLNELTQFLHAMTSSQGEITGTPMIINYSGEQLFHSCPLETKQQSTYLYRFGQLLYHLDTDHPDVRYEYCTDCKEGPGNGNLSHGDAFERHIQDKHWGANKGYQLSIWPSK